MVEFCDKNTHNSEAPNMQNKMCNYKSTWEIIMESDDFRNSSVVNSLVPPFETTFELLQTQDRAVSLVLDVSGSMNTVRINILQANLCKNCKKQKEVTKVKLFLVNSVINYLGCSISTDQIFLHFVHS